MYFSISKHVLNTQSVVSKVEQLRPEAPRRFCHIFCSLVPWNSLDLNSFTEPLDTTDLRSKYSCICCFNIIFLCCAPSDILRTQLLKVGGGAVQGGAGGKAGNLEPLLRALAVREGRL